MKTASDGVRVQFIYLFLEIGCGIPGWVLYRNHRLRTHFMSLVLRGKVNLTIVLI